MKKFMFSVAVICAMFFFVSCGGSDNSDNSDNKENEKTDTEETVNPDEDAAEEEEDDSDEPATLPYPEAEGMCNENGKIAANITIFDDKDVEHHLAEWYKKNNPESKLIWLIFTTYDCPYCQILEEKLLEINLPEYREQGFKILLVLNGLLAGEQPELEPAKISDYKETLISLYPKTAKFELYGYLKNEEDQKTLMRFMGLKGGYPTHMFIDAKTMEILDWMAGFDESLTLSIQDEIEYYLMML